MRPRQRISGSTLHCETLNFQTALESESFCHCRKLYVHWPPIGPSSVWLAFGLAELGSVRLVVSEA